MVQMEQFKAASIRILDPLDRIGWLSEQSDRLKQWCVNNGRWRSFKAGQIAYLEGDAADGLYGIGSGALDIEYAPEGLQTIICVRAQPGGWLGQEVLIPGRSRPINLVAPVESRIFFVPRQALLTLVNEQPDMWSAFLALSIKQNLRMMELLCDALYLTPDARLARLLVRLSVTKPEITASQHDLCALLGMPRTSFRRALASLHEAGAIRTSYRKIEVADRNLLEKIATVP